MSSTHSTDPLLGPPSPGDDQYTPTEDYFRSHQRVEDRDVGASVIDRSSVASYDTGAPFSPSSVFTPPPTFSEAEGSRDTDWEDSEHQPLLSREDSPPPYDGDERTDTKWQTDARKDTKGSSTPSIDIPEESLPFIDDLPQPPEPTKGALHQDQRRKSIINVIALILGGVLCALFILVTVSISRGNGPFSWISVCQTSHFGSRNYQIQRLSYLELNDHKKQNSGLPKGFAGTVHLLSGPPGQTVDLNVSIRSTESDLRKGASGAEWRPRRLSSCAEVSLFFRPGLSIATLDISAKKMNVVLSTDLIVTESTTISLKGGTLVSENFSSSQETYISTKGGTVRGAIGLRDLLSIKTKSGSISVDVLPQAAMSGRPQPAVLEVESKSSSVHLNYPTDHADIPDREYRCAITSQSGSVTGTILHGRETTIDVSSGNINARVLPYASGAGASSLNTKMRSGSTSITVLKPYSGPGNRQHSISSSHSARSGQLNLRYPDEWQGSIDGQVKSGNLNLRGRDVEILEQGARGALKYVHARKGQAASKLKFEIKSGNVDVVVGSE